MDMDIKNPVILFNKYICILDSQCVEHETYRMTNVCQFMRSQELVCLIKINDFCISLVIFAEQLRFIEILIACVYALPFMGSLQLLYDSLITLLDSHAYMFSSLNSIEITITNSK